MKELMSYLPEYYRSSPEMTTTQEAFQPEIDVVWAVRDDYLAQLDPNTATWGLDYWEDAFGLSGAGKELSVRRAAVIARIRGTGTLTVERLRQVVQSFLPGYEIEIVEYYSEYTVEIAFEVWNVLPPGTEELKEALAVIMPAHLKWYVKITMCADLYLGGYFTHRAITRLPVFKPPIEALDGTFPLAGAFWSTAKINLPVLEVT